MLSGLRGLCAVPGRPEAVQVPRQEGSFGVCRIYYYCTELCQLLKLCRSYSARGPTRPLRFYCCSTTEPCCLKAATRATTVLLLIYIYSIYILYSSIYIDKRQKLRGRSSVLYIDQIILLRSYTGF